MDSLKKTKPKKINRIGSDGPVDPKAAFIGILDGKVSYVALNNDFEDVETEESVDRIINCETFTRGDDYYERRAEPSK
jgi:hypothetical protein